MKQDSFSKKYIKSHFNTAYSVARSVRNTIKNERAKKLSAKEDNATHLSLVPDDAPIKKIYINSPKKRLNVVVSEMDSLSEPVKAFLVLATTIAHNKNYELRIIVRNSLPNPKAYNDLLQSQNIGLPKSVSFYTDCHERVSSSIYALETTADDVFFTLSEIDKLKEWGKHE